MYTNGSDISGQSCLGVAVVHVPTCTTIYIDTWGTDETRTIMRAELVAIYTALGKFAAHEWVGIFKDSFSSFQTIRHRYKNPGAHGSQHYHHHMLLLSGITDLLEERRRRRFSTTLHKIRPTQTSGAMTLLIHPPKWWSHNTTPYRSHKS